MTKIPLITIIGVPNTGKSTLFNRIIGQRKALVHSSPGMTRDIFKKSFELNGKLFYIQDSGGFFLDENIITDEINKRIFREAQKSDLIIFLFDGKRELLGYEKDLFWEIRKVNSSIISVINKVDNPTSYLLPNSYYELKQDLVFISAEHNNEIESLLQCIDNFFENYKKNLTDESTITQKIQTRISIMGKPNVGKSSIINKILNNDFVIVSPLPGTTRDSVDLEIKRKQKTFILVDNAGVRRMQKVKESTECAAVIRAEKDIQQADIIIFVIDISRRIDQNDLLIAKLLLKSTKPVIVACNKWDLIENKERGEALLSDARKKLNFFYFAPFILVSALSGKNIFHLIDLAEEINNKISNKIKTSFLNRVFPEILKERKILTEANRPFNPKYLTIESYKPFFFHLRASSDQKLKPSSELYLKKRIVEEFGLEGIPIFFKITKK